MSEALLIRHCAPTLAGIKPGNLFNIEIHCEPELAHTLQTFNADLNPKGVYVTCLRYRHARALLYVYRPRLLMDDFAEPERRAFLIQKGYDPDHLAHALAHLAARLQDSDAFPHEIGLFLGYPLADVKAFIADQGKNSTCVGYWRVYTNAPKAEAIFDRYRQCTNTFCARHAAGCSLCQLTATG